MKKKVLMLLMSAIMVVTMMPALAFAEDEATPAAEPATEAVLEEAAPAEAAELQTVDETDVCKIGDKGYATLDAAIAEGNGKTIVLIDDFELSTYLFIPVDTTVTIDLNGKTITSKSNWALLNRGDLTLNDSYGNGGITATYPLAFYSNSKTTINGGYYTSVEGALISAPAVNATVTINAGVFKASDNAVIADNGSNREGKPNVITINGGRFEGKITTAGYIACGIYAPWKDIVTFNGGTIDVTNGVGIVARSGQIKVTGGTINVSGSAKGRVGDKAYDIAAGQAVFFDDTDPTYPSYNAATDGIVLTGGQYNVEPVAKYIAKGYVAAPQADGTYVVKQPSIQVISTTLPLKKKQSIDLAANFVMTEGDVITSVTSSNPKVATITGTVAKGKKKGKTTITVATKYGVSAAFVLKVQNGKVKASKVYVSIPTSVTLKKGETLAIGAYKLPVTCKTKIKYSSSKKKVAKVSKSGIITAKKTGGAKIYVRCGGKKVKIKVKVVA